MNKPNPTETIMTLNNNHIVSMWHNSGIRISGERVANELFALQSFSVTSRSQFKDAKKLAVIVVASISELIEKSELEFRARVDELQKEIDAHEKDPLLDSLSIVCHPQAFKKIKLPGQLQWPIINQFLRIFIILDKISSMNNKLYNLGAINKKTTKDRSREYAKPLWVLMTKIEETCKNYHIHRKL